MIPQICKTKHNPPDTYGDCLQACVASMLNMDMSEVPHFHRDGDDQRGNKEFKDWLQVIGLRPFYMAFPSDVPLKNIFTMMEGVNTEIEYLLFCSVNDGDHCVVCKNDQVIHDPAWYRSNNYKAGTNDFWVVVVFVHIV